MVIVKLHLILCRILLILHLHSSMVIVKLSTRARETTELTDLHSSMVIVKQQFYGVVIPFYNIYIPVWL